MKGTVFVALGAIAISSAARASEPPNAVTVASADPAAYSDRVSDSAVDRAGSDSFHEPRLPREPRASRIGSASLLPHARLTLGVGSANFRSNVPVGCTAATYQGRAGQFAMSLGIDGRRFLYDVDAGFGLGTASSVSRDNMPTTKATALSVRAGASLPIATSSRAQVTAGLALDVRAGGVGSYENGDEFLTTWQTAVPGAQVHARVDLSSRLSLSAKGFAGASPLAGRFDAFDVAKARNVPRSGALSTGYVLAGVANASLRASDRVTVAAGLTARNDGFRVGNGTWIRDGELAPFVGIETSW